MNEGTRTVIKAKKIGREELVLYALGTCVENRDSKIDKDNMAEALEINRDALNRHLLYLRENRLIREESYRGSCGHIPTREGWERFEEIRGAIHDTCLIPEIHDESGRLGDILPTFKGPTALIKISSSVIFLKPLDIRAFRISLKSDSTERIAITELEDVDIFLNDKFETLAAELMLAGAQSKDPLVFKSNESVRDALIYAETLRKRSKPKEGIEIFRSVAGRCGVKSGFRVFGMVGIVKCTRAIMKDDTALKMVEEFLDTAVLNLSPKGTFPSSKQRSTIIWVSLMWNLTTGNRRRILGGKASRLRICVNTIGLDRRSS